MKKALMPDHAKISIDQAAFLAAIIASSDDAIVSKTLHGIITTWNKAAEKLFGYTAKEAIGKHISLVIPKHLLKEEDMIISRLRKGLRIEHFETVRQRKDGSFVNVSLSISPIKDSNGKVIGAAKIARNITKEKIAERKLLENEERLRIALEAGKIGVWEWEVTTNMITWSDRVYEIHGVNKKTFKLNYENYRKLIHEEDAKLTQQAIDDALKGIRPYSVIFRIVLPGGEVKWVSTRAVVMRDEKGAPIRMLGATLDVTEEKKLEQDKNDFVSIATHELKTPVTSLKVYAELLRRRFARENNDFSEAQMKKMSSQLDRLTNLISDMLDATKIDAGKLHMQEERFNFDALVTEITEELQRTTEKHTLHIKGQTKKHIIADRERTGQVLTNLISNAIKYSPNAKKIEIQARAEREGFVKVCVRDFGVGIPKRKQDKLFERFYRISGPKENTFPGLGLGLYISSEIVKRQGGRIWVESESGKGSTFCFMLPLKKPANAKSEERLDTK